MVCRILCCTMNRIHMDVLEKSANSGVGKKSAISLQERIQCVEFCTLKKAVCSHIASAEKSYHFSKFREVSLRPDNKNF